MDGDAGDDDDGEDGSVDCDDADKVMVVNSIAPTKHPNQDSNSIGKHSDEIQMITALCQVNMLNT